MVKEIIVYECEICGNKSTDKDGIERCEKRGVPELLPIGTVYQMYKEPEMVFAVVKQFPNDYPHMHSYSTWACRDTPAGDTLGENHCGLNSGYEIYSPDKTTPAYSRLIMALEAKGITPIDC